MATIQDLYEAVEAIRLREELPTLIQATSYEIDTLVISQLDKGLLSTGEKIAPSYRSPAYAKKKYWQYNSAPGLGIPDLKLTGKYYAGIGVAVKQDEYDIESNTEYADGESIAQYGDNLLRLSDESMQVYCDDTLQPAIQNYITEKTGLIFE